MNSFGSSLTLVHTFYLLEPDNNQAQSTETIPVISLLETIHMNFYKNLWVFFVSLSNFIIHYYEHGFCQRLICIRKYPHCFKVNVDGKNLPITLLYQFDSFDALCNCKALHI